MFDTDVLVVGAGPTATAPTAVRPIRNTCIGLAGRVPAVQRALAERLSGLVYRCRRLERRWDGEGLTT